MIETQLFDIEKILTLETPEFIIENAKLQDLNGGIRKKFTSLSKSPVTYTTIYDPILFKWDFGDGSPILETDQRVTYHTYKKPGTYLVQHQACNFCTCSGWGLCFQSIDVVPPAPGITPWLVFGGLIGFVTLKKRCEENKTEKECDKRNDCQWDKLEKRCGPKCTKGYRLKKVRVDKGPAKLECKPIHKKESK